MRSNLSSNYKNESVEKKNESEKVSNADPNSQRQSIQSVRDPGGGEENNVEFMVDNII